MTSELRLNDRKEPDTQGPGEESPKQRDNKSLRVRVGKPSVNKEQKEGQCRGRRRAGRKRSLRRRGRERVWAHTEHQGFTSALLPLQFYIQRKAIQVAM